MIYITGDTHGDRLLFANNNLGDNNWTADDILIVCGDFGYVISDSCAENTYLDFLETKPYTICFCDGNHDNFPLIFSYSKVKWNGGYVHKIRNNIFHLMRGQVYEIQGKKIFTFGGAYSVDKATKMLKNTYWSQEIPSNEEYHEAIENLEANKLSVDIIITHTAPREIILRMGKWPDAHDGELTGFLEWIMKDAKFDHWYFGHWHQDKYITDNVTAVYMKIHRIT